MADEYRHAMETALACPLEVAREAPAMLAVLRRLVAAAKEDARRCDGGAISWFDAECSEIAREARWIVERIEGRPSEPSP